MTRRWVPHTVRARLTAWHVATMVVVLGVYVSVVLLLVRSNLSGALDARLRSDYRWAAEMAQQGPDGALSWFEGDPWSADGPWLQVWSPSGQLIYRTAVASRLPVPESEILVARADGAIVAVPAEPAPFRLLGDRATVGGQPVVIQVGRSEAFMRLEVRELAFLLLLGLPLTVAVAGAGGYVLARGALAPLQRMAERAQAITAARLSDRLPIDNPRDELGRLAAVFNDTLGRLESSFKQMRRFTSNVSHELRTPLTAIRTVGEVGLRERRDAASYQHVKLTRQALDLGQLADEVVAHLEVLAEEKGQSLSVEQVGRPTCHGDQITLRQAVINLVDNAIRYTPDGGAIRLRVLESAAGAILEVHDTGPGVPEGDQARLFDRLYRGRQSDEAAGSGLGLSIARWAVEAHQGHLSYEPAPGGGSTFRISLPISSSSSA